MHAPGLGLLASMAEYASPKLQDAGRGATRGQHTAGCCGLCQTPVSGNTNNHTNGSGTCEVCHTVLYEHTVPMIHSETTYPLSMGGVFTVVHYTTTLQWVICCVYFLLCLPVQSKKRKAPALL